MESIASSFNSTTSGALSFLNNPHVDATLKLLLILYGGLAAPHLPANVLGWFQKVPFKILVMFLIVYQGNRNPALAIAIAVAFLVSLNLLQKKKPFESFKQHQD